MIGYVVAKSKAVVRLISDRRRAFRDHYSSLYPHGVVRRACKRYPQYDGIKVFIETGTFQGKTARQESRYFREVHTIELNEDLFRQNTAAFSGYPNIHAYHGDSVAVLPQILAGVHEPCVVFLDAHWSGDHSVDWAQSEWKGYGLNTSYRGEKWPPDPDQQCPVVEEASIINGFAHRCIIVVDDWEVAGTTNRKFNGEDWSSINLDRVKAVFSPGRLEAWMKVSYKGKVRLVLLLRPAVGAGKEGDRADHS